MPILKPIDVDELEGVAGGISACAMARLPPQNLRNGLVLADIAWQDARSRGVSSCQFNRMGWRAYAESRCGRPAQRRLFER